MAILPLVIAPDPLLKQVSQPVTEINDELRRFMDDMLETMYHEDGAGIAAVQVGVLKRILVLDINEHDDKKNPVFIINPEFVYLSEEQKTYNEGCISFPNQRLELARPEKVKIKYLDYWGKPQELEAEGYMARGIQHEIDHLNGITLPDHTSTLKRDMMMRKAKKVKKILEDK